MRKYSLMALVFCLLMTYQNCHPQHRSMDSFQTTSQRTPPRSPSNVIENPQTFGNEIDAAAAPFADQKVLIQKINGQDLSAIQAKVESVILPAGERLIFILNNDCARENPGLLSRRAYDENKYLSELQTQTYIYTLPEPLELNQLQQMAEQDSCVIGLTTDEKIRATSLNDPQLSRQLHYLSIGGLDAEKFFSDSQIGASAAVVVAVIDSGINYNHDDLKNQVWKNPTNGAIGYNFRNNNTNTFDDYGHGTFVAGLIAAQANNSIGIAGVMGTNNIKIMPLKIQDSQGNAYISDMNISIDYARSKAVDVINISMEGDGDQPALRAALNAAVSANIVVVAAAGNSGQEITNQNIVVPAYYSAGLAGMLTVGSTDAYSGQRSSFSNFSTTYVEIVAPGSGGVYSTHKNGGYDTNQGTSFSAPLVAGAAALVCSFFKKHQITYNAALVENTLLAAAVKRSSLQNEFAQGRILDLRGLAEYLKRTYLSPIEGGYDEN